MPGEETDVRLDGMPWPKSPQEIAALLAELDALPTLLRSEEADRMEVWRAAEKERQKALSASSEHDVGFSSNARGKDPDANTAVSFNASISIRWILSWTLTMICSFC